MSNEMIVRLVGGKQINVDYAGFEIPTDQHPDNGGEGAAPEPFDLFLAAVGSCAGAYIASFCMARNLPVEGIRIVETWTRDDQKRMAAIDLAIELPDDFPERYRAAVVRASEQCSIKKMLAAPPEVRAHLA